MVILSAHCIRIPFTGARSGDLDELGASVVEGRLRDVDELGAESSGKKVYCLSNCSIHNETTYTKHI